MVKETIIILPVTIGEETRDVEFRHYGLEGCAADSLIPQTCPPRSTTRSISWNEYEHGHDRDDAAPMPRKREGERTMPRVITYQHAYDTRRSAALCERHDHDETAFGSRGAVLHGEHAGTCDECARQRYECDPEMQRAREIVGAPDADYARQLTAEVALLVGDDGTGDNRVCVDAALTRNPDATVEEIADGIREAREDWAVERARGQ